MKISGATLRDFRRQVMQQLRRFSGGDPEMAADAASFGMAEALSNMALISDQPNAEGLSLEARVLIYMQTAAKQELGRLRRYKQRVMSTNEPASDEEGETREKGDIVTYRRHTETAIENFCDASRVARIVDTLPQADIDLFLMVADGLTAESIALERGITPMEARTERARVLATILGRIHVDGYRGMNGAASPREQSPRYSAAAE